MVKVEELAKALAADMDGCIDESNDGDNDPLEFVFLEGGNYDLKNAARAVLTCLLDDPTISRETRRHLEAILSEGTDNG